MSDHEIFRPGPLTLQSGVTLPDARLAFKTYGELNSAGDNAVLIPTFFGGGHDEIEMMLGPGRALDPAELFVIVVNTFGNGLSSSPSNTAAPFDGPSFPDVTLYDNVSCQHRLVTEQVGVERLRLVTGFSMGAQQAYQWGALYPDMVDAIAPVCGSAKTSDYNRLFLDAARSALTASVDFHDGAYTATPTKGLTAFIRVLAAAFASAAFYREREYTKLGLDSPAATVHFFEGFFGRRDANDLLALLWTWEHADISANDTFGGDLGRALRAIRARVAVMPSDTDLLLGVDESEAEVEQMSRAEVRPIRSEWGHLAGFGAHPADNAAIDAVLNELLAR